MIFIQKYFSYILVSNKISQRKHYFDLGQIVSDIIDIKILSTSVINHKTSYLKKIGVSFQVKQKILYISNETCEIRLMENKFFKTAYITLPFFIEGSEIERLLKKNIINIKINIQDVSSRILNKASLITYIYLYIEAIFKPTYEICYSIKTSEKTTDLYVMFENGSYNCMYDLKNKINIRPKWGPSGEKIAFLSRFMNKYTINVIDVFTNKVKNISDLNSFIGITDFCWVNKNKIIFYANARGISGLFLLDIDLISIKNIKKLFIEDKCFKLKSVGSYIAYLKKNIENTMLNLMNLDNDKEIVVSANVVDFEWSFDGSYLVYIKKNSINESDMIVYDLLDFSKYTILSSKSISVRSIKYCPNSHMIAFIGCKKDIDNIYVYDIEENQRYNITNNKENIHINDIVWKIDGEKIYYAYTNKNKSIIKSISLNGLKQEKIIDIYGTNVQMSYRPMII